MLKIEIGNSILLSVIFERFNKKVQSKADDVDEALVRQHRAGRDQGGQVELVSCHRRHQRLDRLAMG